MDKKLPFRSQLADLLLSDMICLTIESLLLTGSTELVRNHCSSSNIDEPIPTHRQLQKNHFSVQLHMIEITFIIASILMQNVI